ncbi:MAG: DUF1232 domain-containing protein [Lachnospiraceae bacterium]|nr:DUF1232 domain-containing protein [Lachnospiraceae bacterium]
MGYALSPVDLIPDFIPVLGYLDDILLVSALVAFTIRLIPADVWERSREKSVNLWTDGRTRYSPPRYLTDEKRIYAQTRGRENPARRDSIYIKSNRSVCRHHRSAG